MVVLLLRVIDIQIIHLNHGLVSLRLILNFLSTNVILFNNIIKKFSFKVTWVYSFVQLYNSYCLRLRKDF